MKGRLKVSVERTGYEAPLHILIEVAIYAIIAVIACALFSGSCDLCAAMIPPLVQGVPMFAIAGFAVSISLAIYSIKKLVKIARRL